MTVIKGEAYILRTCNADMTSHAGFVWPREGMVEAPDWKPTDKCGNGLHGFLWGEGYGQLADWSKDAVWIVARVSEWVELGGKVKFPRAEVVFAGARHEATQEIIRLGARGAVMGVSLTGGYGSTLTGGYGSTLTGGYGSTLTGGDRSTLTGEDHSVLTGGDRSTLTGEDHSVLTGGYGSTLTGGDRSTLTGGYGSTLTGGDRSTLTGGYGGILQIAFWDGNRRRIATGYVGENGIKPDTPYRLNDQHEFVEVTQ